MTKVPYNPKTGNHVSLKIPDSFTDFDSTAVAMNHYDSIGIRDGRRRPTPLGEMPILSGMVYCTDCGSNCIRSNVKIGHKKRIYGLHKISQKK